jgi:hypothetical protein
MAKNNSGTLIAVVIGGVLLYMLVKGGAFKSSASGAQTAGTRATGVPTNPFASALSRLGLQMPNQFGVGTPVVFTGSSTPTLGTGSSDSDVQFLENLGDLSEPGAGTFTAPNGGVGGGLGITGSD